MGVDRDRVSVEVADARALPADDGSFDLIVATEVIEHVPDPERLVGEIARCLAPHGHAIASAPTNLPWGPHLSVFEGQNDVKKLYERAFVLEEFRSVPLDRNASMTFALLRRR